VTAVGNGTGASTSPALRVISGSATPEEIAVILALVAASSGSAAEPDVTEVNRWNDRSAHLRTVMHPGQGAWRASALPR
jgi:hypothetical protein